MVRRAVRTHQRRALSFIRRLARVHEDETTVMVHQHGVLRAAALLHAQSTCRTPQKLSDVCPARRMRESSTAFRRTSTEMTASSDQQAAPCCRRAPTMATPERPSKPQNHTR